MSATSDHLHGSGTALPYPPLWDEEVSERQISISALESASTSPSRYEVTAKDILRGSLGQVFHLLREMDSVVVDSATSAALVGRGVGVIGNPHGKWVAEFIMDVSASTDSLAALGKNFGAPVLLTSSLPKKQSKKERALALLDSWLNEPDGVHENEESLSALMRSLDDDRIGSRPLFRKE